MLAVSQRFGLKFSNVKLGFDISMVVISLITCMLLIHSLGSVGIGTVVAAVLVGLELKGITRLWGQKRDAWLHLNEKMDLKELIRSNTPLLSIMKKEVYTIEGDASILEALQLLIDKGVSGVPVTDKDQKLIGFVSDGDIIRFLAEENPLFVNVSSLVAIDFDEKMQQLVHMKVSEISRKKVVTVDAESNLRQVCSVLSEYHIKKAPVMHDGEMIGMINISNITKYIVSLVA